jgi:Zn-dependent M28 family amino/carboxypeptidase
MKRRALVMAGLACALVAAEPGERWWRHVLYLADDKLEGRLTGSQGHRQAAAYVAAEFEKAGLQPAGTNAYIQPVKFHARRIDESHSSLALVRDGALEPLVLGEDAYISTRVDPAPALEAPLVFAGYGLVVPEMHHDDLAGLDVRGKIVVYLSGGPSNIPGPLRSHYQSARERNKFLERAGAIGTVSIQNPKSMDIPWPRASLSRFQVSMSLADPALNEERASKLSVVMNPAHAGKLFASSGHKFADLLSLADAGKPLPRFPLPLSLRAKAAVDRSEVESQNVVGLLPGTDPELKSECVVLTAHLDHLGIGEPIGGDRIYNGAMDDASGVASLLDMAESLHESGARLRRSLLFLAVTGEEKGLLGSAFFARHPTVEKKSIVADLNVDMFLPLFPLRRITVYGLNESTLGREVREVGARLDVAIQDDLEPQRNIFIRSDQYSFIREGVPALAFKVGYEKGSPEEQIARTWLKERYHAPSDDIHQPVDKASAAKFNQVVLELAKLVANRTDRPRWNGDSFFRRFSE